MKLANHSFLFFTIKAGTNSSAAMFCVGSATITNCIIDGGSVTATIASGFVSSNSTIDTFKNWQSNASNQQQAKLSLCINSATIQGGEIASGISSFYYSLTITQCVNIGSVTAGATQSSIQYAYAGGIAAFSHTSDLNYCVNNGTITGVYAGGISAEIASDVKFCVNAGNVYALSTNPRTSTLYRSEERRVGKEC